MTRIVLSAYRCDPYGVSEAYAGFMTAALMARHASVLLCTPRYNVPAVGRWILEQPDDVLRENLQVLPVHIPDVDARLGQIGTGAKPGFFLYDRLLLAMLRGSRHLHGASVVWHRTPMSYRFRSSLYSLGLPFMVGPVGGGLKPPAVLADFFRDESAIYRLRGLDGLLLSSKAWMKPFDQARVVLATCEYMRELLPARLSAKISVVLDTGVDVAVDVPEHGATKPLTVLFVGRLVRYKAPTLAIEAFARFLGTWQQGGHSARLVVVGDGPERTSCLSLAQGLGVADQVEFRGALARHDVEAQYAAADVFLFPSVTEASGNVYLEAMRAGLPLIVTANGGGRDIPCDDAAEKIPVMAYERMADAFAKAILGLAADPGRRRAMGAAGFRHVRDTYSWPVISAKLLQAVEQASQGRPD